MRLGKFNYSYILMVLMFVVFLLDPGNSIFHLKYPVFAMLIIFFLGNGCRMERNVLLFFVTFGGMTLYAVLLGLTNGGNLNFSSGIFISSFLFLMIPIMQMNSMNAIKVFSRCSIILSLAIIVLFILSNVLPYDAIHSMNIWGISKSCFSFGERVYGGIIFKNAYYVSSPMLILPLSFYSHTVIEKGEKKDRIRLIITAMAFFLTGTRNHMLLTVIIPLLFMMRRKKIVYKMLSFSCVIAGLFAFSGILKEFFDKSDFSNASKLSYFGVVFSRLSEKPLTYLTGTGIGKSLYIPYAEKYMDLVEVSYLNCILWFGIPLTILFLIVLIFPFFSKKSPKNEYIKIPYLFFLYMCAFNPFMFNSVGVTVISICVYHLYVGEMNNETICNSTS